MNHISNNDNNKILRVQPQVPTQGIVHFLLQARARLEIKAAEGSSSTPLREALATSEDLASKIDGGTGDDDPAESP